MRCALSTAMLAVSLALATPLSTSAQQVPFERSFDVSANALIDATTIRGKIEVTVGESNRVRVLGAATVRLGLTLPANALELAKRVAANPPVQKEGDTVRLSPPAAEEERRAMTISYQIQVPRTAQVRSRSDSGATTISGVAGTVTVQTQSGAIDLHDLGGTAEVTGSSGAVRVDDVAGDLSVRTASGAITVRGLGAGLRVRTQSGAVNAAFRGPGNADVETSSSSIDATDVRGGLTAATQSGHIRVSGAPSAPWQISSGSGGLEIALDRHASVNLEATSRSGSVRLAGVTLAGSESKGLATGTISGGGPLVRASSRSGSIEISAR